MNTHGQIGPSSLKIGKNSNIEQLISLSSIEELDLEWVEDEIKFLEDLVKEKPSFSRTSFKKDDAVKKLESLCNQASMTSKLIRVLFRLAKENLNSKQLCQDILSTLVCNKSGGTEKHDRNSSQNSYAKALKAPTMGPGKPAKPAPAIPENRPNEITLIPNTNYDSDVKKVNEKLRTQQVVSARKSKAGNIVLRCDKEEDIGAIEDVLKNENFVTVKKMERNLPRMTIFDIGKFETTDELKATLFSKNPYLQSLVNNDKVFEILFFKTWNDTTNVTIKCDPEVREGILKNRSKVFIGLKSCRVSDSFPFMVCYNCQETCSHRSKDCTASTVCRYCGDNHISRNCQVKTDTTKHRCINCSNSENINIKTNSNTHVSNSTVCPLIKSIISNMKANTCYTSEKN